MFEVRIHGRGGQGVVTAAELLSVAAFDQGKHAQAIPSFGSERTGAPVVAYCRIDDRPIRTHDPVTAPDAVVVQDPTLLHVPGIVAGVPAAGFLLVNSSRSVIDVGLDTLAPQLCAARRITVPASELARERLGRPLPNTALLGALAALTGPMNIVTLQAVQDAIRQRFTGHVAEQNVLLAADAYALVSETNSHEVSCAVEEGTPDARPA
jgi:pyruvate ferredoxin oxidoreductase gamma subunit